MKDLCSYNNLSDKNEALAADLMSCLSVFIKVFEEEFA